MYHKLLLAFIAVIAIIIGTSAPLKCVYAKGIFDWMSPNRWFNNNRDYDRGYYRRNYYPGYNYPGYNYPGWGGYYPGYTYPGVVGYPGYVYPQYTYPAPAQQNTQKSSPIPPTPQ